MIHIEKPYHTTDLHMLMNEHLLCNIFPIKQYNILYRVGVGESVGNAPEGSQVFSASKDGLRVFKSYNIY